MSRPGLQPPAPWHIRIARGYLKTQVPGPHPDQQNQNLCRRDPGVSAFSCTPQARGEPEPHATCTRITRGPAQG